MKAYQAYIFDLDGTLYRGNAPLPCAAETLVELRRRGAAIRFLTNNSGQTRPFYADKLQRLGFEAEADEVYSSAIGTVMLLKEWKVNSAFVVGNPGLVTTLREAGIDVVNADENGEVFPSDAPAEVCIVGICLQFTYALMNSAMQQIRKGTRFVATNRDSSFPLEGGVLTPGAGSLVAAVQTCSGVEPFVVGKPNPFLVRCILNDLHLSPEEVLVVGDRMDTDISAGRAAGCDTHLVMTGVTDQPPIDQSASADLTALL